MDYILDHQRRQSMPVAGVVSSFASCPIPQRVLHATCAGGGVSDWLQPLEARVLQDGSIRNRSVIASYDAMTGSTPQS
jgi:hypothetical protein